MQRALKIRERISWTAMELLERIREGNCGIRGGRYWTDAAWPPGMSWQSVDDARRHFIEAGLVEVESDWLDAVADVDRRTASLRWRIAGRLPRFFTLTWQRSA